MNTYTHLCTQKGAVIPSKKNKQIDTRDEKVWKKPIYIKYGLNDDNPKKKNVTRKSVTKCSCALEYAAECIQFCKLSSILLAAAISIGMCFERVSSHFLLCFCMSCVIKSSHTMNAPCKDSLFLFAMYVTQLKWYPWIDLFFHSLWLWFVCYFCRFEIASLIFFPFAFIHLNSPPRDTRAWTHWEQHVMFDSVRSRREKNVKTKEMINEPHESKF